MEGARLENVDRYTTKAAAARAFSGSRSLERLIESYRPADEAAFDHMLDLVQRGRLNHALEEYDQGMREAMVTGDLPILLGGSVDVHVRNGWTAITENWRQCFLAESYSNFRQQSLANFGDLLVDSEPGGLAEDGMMPVIPEAHQYSDARLDEEVEYAELSTYGCTFMVTRQMMKNDDRRSLTRIPAAMGASMKRTINYHVAVLALENNPLMADGNALCSAAHGNFVAGATPLTHANLVAQTGLFTQQPNPSGRPSRINPKYLIVPQLLEIQARHLVSDAARTLISIDQAAAANLQDTDYNVLAGMLVPVTLEELTDPNDWYLAADPNIIPTIEVGFLDGRETPETFTQDSHDVDLHAADGMTYKIRHDFDAYPAAWSGIRRMTG